MQALASPSAISIHFTAPRDIVTSFRESPLSPGGDGQAWALITGGSGRGGAAIARALHARGLSVVIHHTPRDFAAENFSVPAWLASKGVTVVVCNASAYHASDVGDIDRTHIDIAIHIGAHAAILATLRPRPDQPKALRSVVAVTDIAVDRAPKGHVSYTTAKGALQSMILALANDWAPHVRFNVVQPGTLPYPETWADAERAKRINESIPLGRIGTFEELAGAVVYLAIDATYVTGQVLAVDGGRSRQLY